MKVYNLSVTELTPVKTRHKMADQNGYGPKITSKWEQWRTREKAAVLMV